MKRETKNNQNQNIPCEDAQLLFQDYLDGNLLAHQKEALDAHLASCPLCRQMVTSLQILDYQLGEVGEVEVTEDISDRIMACLPKLPLSRRIIGAVAKGHPLLTMVFFGLTLLLGVTAAYQFGIYSARFQTVEIIMTHPGAQMVTLLGDFNQWDPKGGVRMIPGSESDTWHATLRLSPGVYHYNFLVDESIWLTDPEALVQVADGFGGKTSVLVVPG